MEREYDESDFSGCVEMVDYEADGAHAGELPKDVVYFGYHGTSDLRCPQDFAWDGQTYLQQSSDGLRGFVVVFDDEGNPNPEWLAEIKTFVTHRNKVKAILARK